MSDVRDVGLIFDDAVPADLRSEAVRTLKAMPTGHRTATGARIAVMEGGASNANLLVSGPCGDFVLRLAEQDVERFGIDRERGLMAHQLASDAGIAPRLLDQLLPEGHCLSRFVSGEVLTSTGLRERRLNDRQLLLEVGKLLARVHDAGRINGRWSVFDDVRRNINIARHESLTLPEDWRQLEEAVAKIEAVFNRLAAPERLCHNDLQLQNFIITTDGLSLVDWEYAAMGSPYFDLGGFAVNAELDNGEEADLVGAYFGSYAEAEKARVRLMRFMSAIREATWSIIAGPVLTLDWDYVAWANDYFARARVEIASGRLEECLKLAEQPPYPAAAEAEARAGALNVS